jgi:hypothetical protein
MSDLRFVGVLAGGAFGTNGEVGPVDVAGPFFGLNGRFAPPLLLVVAVVTAAALFAVDAGVAVCPGVTLDRVDAAGTPPRAAGFLGEKAPVDCATPFAPAALGLTAGGTASTTALDEVDMLSAALGGAGWWSGGDGFLTLPAGEGPRFESSPADKCCAGGLPVGERAGDLPTGESPRWRGVSDARPRGVRLGEVRRDAFFEPRLLRGVLSAVSSSVVLRVPVSERERSL